MRYLAVLLLATAAAAAEPVAVLDFDEIEPGDGWRITNLTLREFSIAKDERVGSSRGLEIVGEDRGKRFVGYIYRPLPESDWRGYAGLSFRARVKAERPVEMRLLLFEGKRPRCLLKRFTLPPGDWREVVLPFPAFRENLTDQIASFRRIGGLTIRWDRGTGSVAIDGLRLNPGDRGDASCRPTIQERTALAFPGGKVKAKESEHFVLISNVSTLKGSAGKKLLARLEEAYALLGARYGVTGQLDEKVPLLVFAKEAGYRAFYERLGKHLGVGISAPETDGYSALGIVASTWDRRQGWDRPVYVHEATHGAVYRLLHLGSNGNWIQEALASGVQGTIHPKALEGVDLPAAFADLKAGREGRFLPWKTLLAKPRQPPGRHAQLYTIVEYLSDRHRAKLPAVWTAVSALDKSLNEAAPAAIAEVLGKTPAELEADWLAWGIEH